MAFPPPAPTMPDIQSGVLPAQDQTQIPGNTQMPSPASIQYPTGTQLPPSVSAPQPGTIPTPSYQYFPQGFRADQPGLFWDSKFLR